MLKWSLPSYQTRAHLILWAAYLGYTGVTSYHSGLDRVVTRNEDLLRSLSPYLGMICNRVRSIRADILPHTASGLTTSISPKLEFSMVTPPRLYLTQNRHNLPALSEDIPWGESQIVLTEEVASIPDAQVGWRSQKNATHPHLSFRPLKCRSADLSTFTTI